MNSSEAADPPGRAWLDGGRRVPEIGASGRAHRDRAGGGAVVVKVILRAHLEDRSGYGQHVGHLGRQLERLGHAVRFEPLNPALEPPDYCRARLAAPGEAGRVLQVCPPFLPCPPGAVYGTTWEGDVLPPACVAHLADARLVVVNSRFIRDAFVRSGVRPPVVVVPLGVDPGEYRPTHDPPAACRFGVVANLAYSARRKNVAGAVAAFRLAFGADPRPRLAIKVNRGDEFADPGDPRIEVIRERFTTGQMRAFYNSLTCLVSASMAEGFGLCPLQAMACGRPVIATTFGGHAEYLDDGVGYPVAYELARPDWSEGGGAVAVPDVGSMARQMRRVCADPAEAAVRGARSAARAAAFSWDRHGAAMARLLA